MFKRKTPAPPPVPADGDKDAWEAERAERLAMMEANTKRRNLLAPRANPAGHTDYVVQLDSALISASLSAEVSVTIRYIPDRDVLDAPAMSEYWRVLGTAHWPSFEDLAVTVLGDLSNVLVPRWIEIVLSADQDGGSGDRGHRVVLQERQPKWRNDALLNRLSQV